MLEHLHLVREMDRKGAGRRNPFLLVSIGRIKMGVSLAGALSALYVSGQRNSCLCSGNSPWASFLIEAILWENDMRIIPLRSHIFQRIV